MKNLTPEQKKKLARDELWRRGDLSFKFHKAQKIIDKVYKSIKGQLFVGNCARQFGKSYWAVCKAIECALSKPNAIIRYGTAFLVDLLRFIIPAFKLIMEDCPESIKGQYVKQGSVILFPNGSRIDLVGIDKNPDSMRGNTLDLIVIDEAGYVSDLDYIYKSVIIPSTTHRPDAKVILISSAPSTPSHPFKEYCDKAELEGAYKLFTIYDNPMVDQETINRLMKESGGEESTTWRREYLCHFVTDSNLQIIPEWNDKYIQDIPHDEFYNLYDKYVAQDIGYRDFTALLFSYYHFKKAALIVEDELTIIGPTSTTQLLADKIKIMEQQMWGSKPPFRRISDNNNLNLLQDLSSMYKLPFIATDKESLEAMVNEVRIMCQNGRILIHPRCKMLIGCLRSGIWDAKKTIFARDVNFGHFDHLAALIYLVRNLNTQHNPIPANYGFQSHNAWIPQTNNNPHKNLTDALLPKALPQLRTK